MAIKYKWLARQLELYAEHRKKHPSNPASNKLPTEQELALRYHVSRQTVRSALKLLEEQGIIKKVQGSGIYLTGRLSDPAKNNIALILYEEPDFSAPEFFQSLSSSLEEHGFFLFCKASHNRFQTERELLCELLKNVPRGLLIQPAKSALPNPNRDLYRLLMKKGCQIVFLFSPCPGFSDLPCVRYDDYYGCRMLLEKLFVKGHTRICALFQSDDHASSDRFLAFMETMQEAGLSVLDCHISWYDSMLAERISSRKTNARLLSSLVPESFSDCTALLCDHDGILWKLLQELDALKRLDLKNPAVKTNLSECTAFGCFLQSHLTQQLKPAQTILLRPDQKMLGALSAQTLLDSIKGLPVQSREVPWMFF